MTKVTSVVPVILSGGSGTRLWPLSRGAKPKQFMSFDGGPTMIKQTLMRCQGVCFDLRPILVGADQHRFMLAEATHELGVEADIVLEPMRRDSCAAIVAGALHAKRRNPNSVILVLASDHRVPDSEAFARAVADALPAAEAGLLVTFGITPRYPATGYGYIKPGDALAGPVRGLEQFVEKPDMETAKTYIAQGYLWNSGNFLFKASAFLEEAQRLAPEVVAAVEASLYRAVEDRDFIRLDEAAFARSPQIAVDLAIMEKTQQATVLPVDYEWSDIGSWDAVAGSMPVDDQGNVIVGDGMIEGGRNVMVHSQGILTTVIGCEDIVVVSTPDAVMVAMRGRTEKVKSVVDQLNTRSRSETQSAIERR